MNLLAYSKSTSENNIKIDIESLCGLFRTRQNYFGVEHLA